MKAVLIDAAVFTAALVAMSTGVARADGWGDVKGQVILQGAVPAKKEIKPDKDQFHCLSRGPLIDDDVIVDPATRGLKNVMIWLAPVQSGGKMPIHSTRISVPKEKVTIDQPCCKFVPRITMMREGQELEVRNSAPVLHNCRIAGSPTANSTINLSIPPGASVTKTLRAERRPITLVCDIHKWMGGRIGVFSHPYFALTRDDGSFEIKNAPAGKFKIFIQHEKFGWVHMGKAAAGQEIEIRSGSGLDLGKIEVKGD
jgi:hypothetical protein